MPYEYLEILIPRKGCSVFFLSVLFGLILSSVVLCAIFQWSANVLTDKRMIWSDMYLSYLEFIAVVY